MGTQVELNEKLGETVRVCRTVEAAIEADPPWMYRHAVMLVIDEPPWTADLEVIRSGLVPKRRQFKDPFADRKPSEDVGREVERLVADADAIFARLYPDFEATDRQSSFRPMITEGEPMHLDTRPGAAAVPFVTAFINISRLPRVYNIGPSLPQLVEWYPKLMREVWRASKSDDISGELRRRTMANKPPLDSKAPKHRVELAPGSIWLFDAKSVSHEVVYGEGVVARGFTVPDSGAPQQPEILARLKRAA